MRFLAKLQLLNWIMNATILASAGVLASLIAVPGVHATPNDQGKEVDPLSRVVSLGVRHAFELQSQKIRLDQEHDRLKTSYANLLPSVSAAASKTYGASESFSSSDTKSFSSANSSSMSVSASWTVWDNFASIRNIQTGTKSLDIERLESRHKVQGYIRSLLAAYLEYEYLLSEREILVARLKESKTTYEESQILVRVGARTKIDAFDAEIEVVSTERELMEKETAITAAAKSLSHKINADSLGDLPRLDLLKLVPYYLPAFERLLAEIRKPSADAQQNAWEEILVRRNPELAKKKLGLEKSELELRQKKFSYFPSTGISVSHSVNMDRYLADDVSGVRGELQSTSVTFDLTWKVWDWFSTSRSIINSQRDFDKEVIEYRGFDKETRVEAESSIEQVAVLQKTIEASRLVVDKSEAQLQYSKEMYRLGRITLLQMQQATRRKYEAQIALSARLNQYYALAAKLMYLFGEELTPPGVDLQWIR